MWVTPTSMAPATTSSRAASPLVWPSVRASPRSLAQRPLPSMTIATCLGTAPLGRRGGTAPDGWAGGGVGVTFVSLAAGRGALGVPVHERQATDLSLEVELGVRGNDPCGIPARARLGRVGDQPVALKQGTE